MRTRRRLALSGNATAYLDHLVSTLTDRGVPITHPDPNGEPVTTFLIAARFTPGMSWDDWWQRDTDDRDAFETVLPRLAPVSDGLLLGYSNTTDPAERREVRAGMHSLVARFQAHAAADRGVDFSMNGIELPATGNHDLLTRRLATHTPPRGLLADGTVIPIEDLTNQSIAEALTTDIL